MKQTEKEMQIQNRMQPGIISSEGFLGDDSRHIHDIIADDEKTLEMLDVTPEEIADKLQTLTDIAYQSPYGPIEFEKFTLEYLSYRGKVICPFVDPGVYVKAVIKLIDKDKLIEFSWTPLHIHMIREHHFFEGKGSKFRLEPELLVKCLF